MQIGEGTLVAADGMSAVSFDGPYFRQRKIRAQFESQILFVLGSAQRLMSTGEVVFDLLDVFSSNLPALEIATIAEQAIPAANSSCQALKEHSMPRVFNDNVATIGVVMRNQALAIFSFDYDGSNELQCSYALKSFIDTEICGPSTVRDILSNPSEPDFGRVNALFSNTQRRYFAEPIIPVEERNPEEALDAVKTFISVSKIICHTERRISPIGDNFDAYLLSSNSTINLSNGMPCND